MNEQISPAIDLKLLGPLAVLAGKWYGEKGDDTAPGDDRGTEKNLYFENMIFEPIGMVNNHEQTLYGLRYSTKATRIGELEPFHEELGYWLWDPAEKQVMRCFLVPRGISLIAGGTVEKDAKSFQIFSELGSSTYGICSNKFLDREFRTVKYELQITIHNDNSFSYEEDTVLQMHGQKELFHHIDKNTMKRA